jgi:hypothetical protein
MAAAARYGCGPLIRDNICKWFFATRPAATGLTQRVRMARRKSDLFLRRKCKLVLGCFLLALMLQGGQDSDTGAKASSVQLSEGYFQLTVTVEDSSLGSGAAGVDVAMKLSRGFLFLGRKKTDLNLVTDKNGRVVIQGLPRGKVELAIYSNPEKPEKFELDLQSGPKNRIQSRSGRLRITLEWKLI